MKALEPLIQRHDVVTWLRLKLANESADRQPTCIGTNILVLLLLTIIHTVRWAIVIVRRRGESQETAFLYRMKEGKYKHKFK